MLDFVNPEEFGHKTFILKMLCYLRIRVVNEFYQLKEWVKFLLYTLDKNFSSNIDENHPLRIKLDGNRFLTFLYDGVSILPLL